MEIAPPVPIDQIKGPTDRFRCEPYRSVMSARACAERQAMSEKPVDTRGGDYVFCVGCEDGARVKVELRLLPASALVRKTDGEGVAPGKRRRPKHQRRKNAAAPKPIVPSEATRAAVASLPKDLPKKPPTSKMLPVAPAAPTESAAVRALRCEIGAVEAGLRGVEAKARAMVSDVRRARDRFARKR